MTPGRNSTIFGASNSSKLGLLSLVPSTTEGLNSCLIHCLRLNICMQSKELALSGGGCYRGAATAQTDLRAPAAFYRLPIILRGVNTSVHYHGLHADGPLSRQIRLVQNDLFALSYFFPSLPRHASAERAMSGLWPLLIPQNVSCFMRLNPAKALQPIFALFFSPPLPSHFSVSLPPGWW